MVLVCQAGWILSVKLRSCQCSALSLRCRRTQLPYRLSAGAPPLSGALQTTTFPLYQPGEACLPFSGLIFLLELLLFTRFLYAVCSLSSFSSFFFFLSHSLLLVLPLQPPNTPLGGLFCFVSLKGRQCSLPYFFLSVCLSVSLMDEYIALRFQERCFVSAFNNIHANQNWQMFIVSHCSAVLFLIKLSSLRNLRPLWQAEGKQTQWVWFQASERHSFNIKWTENVKKGEIVS